MVRNFNTVTILLILSLNYCFCQNDWKPGYIIKNQSDTIYGFIDNRDSRSNSQQCFFRKEVNDKTQTFYPNELIGYRFINGKFYVSKTIEDMNSGIPVFLEFIIHGKANIYHYKDVDSRYFIEKEAKLYELKNTKAIVKIDDSDYLKENKEYIGTLNYLLKDANISTEIKKSELSSNSLKKIAKIYHEKVCTDEQCIIYERRIEPVNINIGLYTGLSLNKINFGNISISDYSTSWLLGFRFEFENIIEWTENLYLVTDITFIKFTDYRLREIEDNVHSLITYNGQSFNLTNEGYGVEYLDVNIKANALKIPLIINYYFSKGLTKPYIGAGLSTMYLITQNEDFVYHWFYNYFNKSIPSFHVGFVGKLGSKFIFKNGNGIYTELTYEYTQTINVNQFYRFAYNGFTLNCGYIF